MKIALCAGYETDEMSEFEAAVQVNEDFLRASSCQIMRFPAIKRFPAIEPSSFRAALAASCTCSAAGAPRRSRGTAISGRATHPQSSAGYMFDSSRQLIKLSYASHHNIFALRVRRWR